MKRFQRTMLVLCVLLAHSYRAQASDPPNAPVTIQMKAAANEDPRLSRPVSLAAASISLKELLDRLSEQIGVRITIDANDPASSYPVLIHCDSVPAIKLLDALYGCLSIKKGEWEWLRGGSKDDYSYSFHETPWAKDRAAIYHRIMSGLLARYMDLMRELSSLKPEDRVKRKEDIRQALLLDNSAGLDYLFNGDYKEWVWYQASFFFNALSKEQQNDVIAGKPVTVELKSLEPSIYNLYHQSFLFSNTSYVDSLGNRTFEPEPASVQFYRAEPNISDGWLGPMIMLKPSTSKGGGSWMATGQLQAGVPSAVKREWMLPGDSLSDKAADVVVKVTKENNGSRRTVEFGAVNIDRSNNPIGHQGAGEAQSRRDLDFRLEQVGAGSSVPIVAVLPPNFSMGFIDPVGKPVQYFLDNLESNTKHHMYKWRDGVLIVSYPGWFAKRVTVVPYSTLAILKLDGTGLAPITQWATLIGSISEEETMWLAAQCHYKLDAKLLRTMLLLLQEYPATHSSNGAFLDADAITALKSQNRIPGISAVFGNHIKFRILTWALSGHGRDDSMRLEWQSDAMPRWTALYGVLFPRYLPTGLDTTIAQ